MSTLCPVNRASQAWDKPKVYYVYEYCKDTEAATPPVPTRGPSFVGRDVHIFPTFDKKSSLLPTHSDTG